jgi:hypothetical protein
MAEPVGQSPVREGSTTVTCLSSSSVYTAIEQHFTTLFGEPDESLTIAVTTDQNLEKTRLTIAEARQVTLDRDLPLDQRDRVWRELIRRARRAPEPWSLAAVWTMLPGLKSATRRVSRTTKVDIADLGSAAITGFLEAVATIDPDSENFGSTLYWSAYNAVRAASRPRPQIQIDATDEIDRSAARITHGTAPAVHSGVVEISRAGRPSRGRLEAERLGSLAQRTGTVDHLHRPCRTRNRLTRIDHSDGLHGRRVVLRVCSTPLRNIAKVPAHPTDRATQPC